MLPGALMFLLAAAPASDPAPQGVAVTTSVVAERVALPRTTGPVKLVVDSMAARVVVLASPRDRAAVAARIAAHTAWICPKAVERPDGVELRCRTRHLDAVLTRDGGTQYLDLRELRGLPWRAGADGPPFFLYDPDVVGLGRPCPGTTSAGNGECLLQTGSILDAARQFRTALRTPNRQLAALRLGDLSLATGDPATAIGWYRRAGTLGVFGRVARTRLCEIDGTCLGSTESIKQLFDPSGLPVPVRAEMTMRVVRAEAYEDRFASALTLMADTIRSDGYAKLCRDSIDRLCRRVLLEILRQRPIRDAEPEKAPAAPGAASGKGRAPAGKGEAAKSSGKAEALAGKGEAAKSSGKPEAPAGKADAAAPKTEVATKDEESGDKAPAVETEASKQHALAERALSLYLELPSWDRGPYAVELAQAAADLSESFGAPVFAANILSAVVPMVPPAEVPDHLSRVAELYVRGGDETRAKLVVEYASVSTPKRMQTARWKSVLKGLALLGKDAASHGELPALDPETVSRETAAALAVSGRAREVMKKRETAAGGQGSAP